jgi:hypothetical protein
LDLSNIHFLNIATYQEINMISTLVIHE